jgi:CheY-like chemotaxis protein
MNHTIEAVIGNSRILIVDDQDENIELLKALLVQAGYSRT